MVRHALEEVRRGPNEASRKMMRYWHAQREREVQRDSGGDRRDTLRCGKKLCTMCEGKKSDEHEESILDELDRFDDAALKF